MDNKATIENGCLDCCDFKTKFKTEPTRRDFMKILGAGAAAVSSIGHMRPAEFGQLCIETDCRRTQRKQLNMSIKYGVEMVEILS